MGGKPRHLFQQEIRQARPNNLVGNQVTHTYAEFLRTRSKREKRQQPSLRRTARTLKKETVFHHELDIKKEYGHSPEKNTAGEEK